MTDTPDSIAAKTTAATIIPDGAEGIHAIAAMASAAHGVTTIKVDSGIYYPGMPDTIPLAIRHGEKPEIVDLRPFYEAWRDFPERKRGTAKALTLQSFVSLVNRHRTAHSVVFADIDWTKPSLTAVIDYHQINGPIPEDPGARQNLGGADNCGHRIHYAYPLSEEWKTWIKFNGEAMNQGEFAAFLEDRVKDLSSPTDFEKQEYERDFATTVATPADVIQLARGLEVNVEAKVANHVKLQSGETRIQFEETHKDAIGKPIVVPGVFLLAIAPFAQGAKVRIPVRLRYRAGPGGIKWLYQIYRPDLAIAERVENDLLLVGEQTTLPVYAGSPET